MPGPLSEILNRLILPQGNVGRTTPPSPFSVLANKARPAADVLSGFVPGLSDVRDVSETVTGQNAVTGEGLSPVQRALTGLGAGLPFVSGSMIRGGQKAAKALFNIEDLKPAQMTLDEIGGIFNKAGDIVDGLRVGKNIPNLSSVESTLTEFEEIPGIREVPFSAFNQAPKQLFSSSDDLKKVRVLSEEIKKSKRIDPLVIALDEEGPFIVEGVHRFQALRDLGASRFPAVVVTDEDSIFNAVKKAISKGEFVRPEILKEFDLSRQK